MTRRDAGRTGVDVARKKKTTRAGKERSAKSYAHPEASALLRPDIGTQAQFRKKKLPATYRYDSSLSPALDWDQQNPMREQAEATLAALADRIAKLSAIVASGDERGDGISRSELADIREELAAAREDAAELKALSKPFLNWAGKAERLSFDVPTLPLFVHERLSTSAILETLKGHTRERQINMFDLFGESDLSIRDRLLKAYEHQNGWVNRLILGDSLVVMNSLLNYEGLGGQVQMVYIDPPYGVRFGSNFQPFVRRRDVKHNDDEEMVREPEMVKAYRDTWELGSHSYLTYLRDRLLIARDLLHQSGSIFVQISDENLHHMREILDEIYGPENFVLIIVYRRLGMMVGETMQSSAHYLVWYARDKERMKTRKVFDRQIAGIGTGDHYTQLEDMETGENRPMTKDEKKNPIRVLGHTKPFQLVSLSTGGYRPNTTIDYEFEGKIFHPGANKCWRTTKEGLDRLAAAGRIVKAGKTLRYKQYLEDFPLTELTTIWTDTARDPENLYVVQTPSNIVARCIHMTTDPGDLVFDPTCGSGTTAWMAERWGRRWIACDTSRVPLALTRQRLLTATYPYFQLQDAERGPAGGFVYERKQNHKGEEIGGIVPHITLKSIATAEPPAEEVIVDQPEMDRGITRVTGAFCFEATIPTPVDWEGDGKEDSSDASAGGAYTNHVERMIEVLRRSPVLHLGGGHTVSLSKVRPPARALVLSAEALIEGNGEQTAAIVFGSENGAVSQTVVFEAAREAYAKGYYHLYVIGFAIQPDARRLVDDCEQAVGVPATYVQASMDLVMGDLLRNLRSSQIFSVCGLPDVRIRQTEAHEHQVELLGLDVFDPVSMDSDHREGNDVPAWFLDTDYNGLCFHVCQAFFPRTAAWEGIKRSLRGEFEDSVWAHLSGTVSAPFQAGEHGQIAVKVIDDRGNELVVVKSLSEART